MSSTFIRCVYSSVHSCGTLLRAESGEKKAAENYSNNINFLMSVRAYRLCWGFDQISLMQCCLAADPPTLPPINYSYTTQLDSQTWTLSPLNRT